MDDLIAQKRTKISNLLKELCISVANDIGQNGTMVPRFNIIDELHANENAHTRILVSLLKHKNILDSFLKLLQNANESFAKQKLCLNCTVAEFTSYIDALIECEKFCIIIENKIHDAPDQDKQIERYISSVRGKGTPIYVVYLTRDGSKKISDSSISQKVRNQIKNALIEINYSNHILPWLDESAVSASVTDKLLSSGLVQYIDHLKGLCGRRNKKKPLDKLKHDIVSRIEKEKIKASELLSEIYHFIYYYQNTESCWQDNNDIAAEIKRDALMMLYSILIKEPMFEGNYYLNKDYGCFSICSGTWSQASPLQIDLYYDGGNKKEYNTKYSELQTNNEISKIEHIDNLEYNGCNYFRFFIRNKEQLFLLFKILDGKNPTNTQFSSSSLENGNVNIKGLLPLKQILLEIAATEEKPDLKLGKINGRNIDSNYYYDEKGFSIQYSFDKHIYIDFWNNDPDKTFDFLTEFNARNSYPHYIVRWGKQPVKCVVRFPITSEEYAKEIAKKLVEAIQ